MLTSCVDPPSARGHQAGHLDRRQFIAGTAAGAALVLAGCDRPAPVAAAPAVAPTSESRPKVSIAEVRPGEDLIGYVRRQRGSSTTTSARP